MSEAAEQWRMLFESWPAQFPTQGIIMTLQGESIGFVNFMTSPGLVIVERDRPDSSNARKVIIAYSNIAMVKSTSPADLPTFAVLGFKPRGKS